MKMKKQFILLLFCCVSLLSLAQTAISGGSVSGTWTKANSPYLIEDTITVENGTKLTIEPGAEIIFQGAYSFSIQGTLIALGTTSDSISFSSVDTLKGWYGIRFERTLNTNDSSRFKYCKIRSGTWDPYKVTDKGGAFYLDQYSKVVITNCLFYKCTNSYGSAMYCKESNPIFHHNLITMNEYTEATVYLFKSNPVISYNIFEKNNLFGTAAIACDSSIDLFIYRNTITLNRSDKGAGGISTGNSTVLIQENIITWNSSSREYWGGSGGIACSGGVVKVIKNMIYGNYTRGSGGGGIGASSVELIIKDNIIRRNGAGGPGGYTSGGICTFDANVKMDNNTIDSNTVGDVGGPAILLYRGSFDIKNNFIGNNWAYSGAGAIYVIMSQDSSNTLSNNIIANNTSLGFYGGGAILCSSGYFRIINNDIVFNDAALGGGIFLTSNATPLIENNIIWGNRARKSGDQIYLDDQGSQPTLIYNDMEGDTAGIGTKSGVVYTGTYLHNLNLNPEFLKSPDKTGIYSDYTKADWRVNPTSPCINAGNPNGGPYALTDFTGQPRVSGGVIDLGVYELFGTNIKDASEASSLLVYPNPSHGEFTIEKEKIKINSIAIYNMLGQCVYTNQVASQKFNINLQDQAKGIYLIKVVTDQGDYIQKVSIY